MQFDGSNFRVVEVTPQTLNMLGGMITLPARRRRARPPARPARSQFDAQLPLRLHRAQYLEAISLEQLLMPPEGGARKPLTASYTWGQQGLEAQFGAVFQPGQGIFSPGYPLAPPEPERVRLWDFPVGVNTIYTPRAYEPISFDELRALADAHDITRLAIETRKDQIEKLDWTIKPRTTQGSDRGRGDTRGEARRFLAPAGRRAAVRDLAARAARRRSGARCAGARSCAATAAARSSVSMSSTAPRSSSCSTRPGAGRGRRRRPSSRSSTAGRGSC